VGFSSETISQSTPLGWRPAKRDKSTAASVWPSRVKTPFSLARRGKICPGRTKSDEVDEEDPKSFNVIALSEALIPVVMPLRSQSIKDLVEKIKR
jgi:hypothetical protein